MLSEHKWKSLSHVQLFETPMDYRLQGSSVHGIVQARILEWVAFPFSRELLNSGIEPRCPVLKAASLPFRATREGPQNTNNCSKPLPTSQNDIKPVGRRHSPRSYCDCHSTDTSKSFGKRKEKRFMGEGGEMWRTRRCDSGREGQR